MKALTKRIHSFSVFIPIFLLLLSLISVSVFAEEESTSSSLIIENIICHGNKKTSCEFIKKNFLQEIGEVLDSNEVTDARLRLGSLLRFKHVRVQLDKGSEKGKIVVAFIVKEAGQYQLGIDLSYLRYHDTGKWPQHIDGYLQLPTVTLTDLNVFGSGKIVSLELRGVRTRSRSSKEYDEDRTGTEYTVNYFDQNLFGSKNYYLNFLSSVKSYGFDEFRDPLVEEEDFVTLSDDEYTNRTETRFEFGRRLDDGAYFEIAAYTDEDYYGFSYGWNTEDDAVFPTRGSQFKISSSNPFDIDKALIYYKKHFDFRKGRIVSVTGASSINEEEGWPIDTSSRRSSVGAQLTLLNEKKRMSGLYSGWYFLLSFSETEKDRIYSNQIEKRLLAGVGYKLQNDYLVINIGVNYQDGELEYREKGNRPW